MLLHSTGAESFVPGETSFTYVVQLACLLMCHGMCTVPCQSDGCANRICLQVMVCVVEFSKTAIHVFWGSSGRVVLPGHVLPTEALFHTNL
jgi:hypothetical protein